MVIITFSAWFLECYVIVFLSLSVQNIAHVVGQHGVLCQVKL